MDAYQVADKLGAGHLMNEMYGELLRVANEVVATGKDGKVTVSLTVKKNPGDISVTVLESVGSSLPKSQAFGALFFYHDGQFYERDPRQAEMRELRVVEEPEAESRG